MKTVWHLKGAKAGSFEQLDDDAADKLIATGKAQDADSGEDMRYPENHPDYVAPKRTTRKKKYPNKMMTTESD